MFMNALGGSLRSRTANHMQPFSNLMGREQNADTRNLEMRSSDLASNGSWTNQPKKFFAVTKTIKEFQLACIVSHGQPFVD